MALHVCMGATLRCSFGVTPSQLVVPPKHGELTENKPAATIMDHIPNVNVLPFGMCLSLANPTVAAATTAAMGVLTPMPCLPATPAPWIPGAPTVIVDSAPALDNSCTLQCLWAGVISVTAPGEFSVTIP